SPARRGVRLADRRQLRPAGAGPARARAAGGVVSLETQSVAARPAPAGAPPPAEARPAPAAEPRQYFEANQLWFKTAIFYELSVRSFYDSNGDGIGDLPGATEKLDYLQWLGVDTIWLLPMYQSPLRDGGYDISDFFQIHPDLG